jgi:hypothetical protein
MDYVAQGREMVIGTKRTEFHVQMDGFAHSSIPIDLPIPVCRGTVPVPGVRVRTVLEGRVTSTEYGA